MMSTKRRPSTIAAVVLSVVVLCVYLQSVLRHVPFYRLLYRHFPFYVPEGLKNVLQVVLVVGALRFLYGLRLREVFAELRLTGSLRPALVVAFIATAPMWLVLGATHRLAPPPFPKLVYLALFAPLVEEITMRAFGVLQLFRRARWSLIAALAASVTITGLGHIDKGSSSADIAMLFAVTGIGGAFFSWLLIEWDNVWVPWAVHASMNMSWEVLSVARTAVGGWLPSTLQLTTFTIAVLLTRYRSKFWPNAFGGDSVQPRRRA